MPKGFKALDRAEKGRLVRKSSFRDHHGCALNAEKRRAVAKVAAQSRQILTLATRLRHSEVTQSPYRWSIDRSLVEQVFKTMLRFETS